MRRLGVGLAVLLALAGASACGSAQPEVKAPATSDAEPTTDDSAGPSAEEQAPEEEATGTRANPAPAGSTAKLSDYTVSLGVTNANANDLVAAENQFNDPPAEGRQFVMVPVTATYAGDESGTPWVDLSINFVGSDGNTYGTAMDDYCGSVPDSLTDQGEMYSGATGGGNVCVSVPTGVVDGGVWVIEETFSFDDTKVFFALT